MLNTSNMYMSDNGEGTQYVNTHIIVTHCFIDTALCFLNVNIKDAVDTYLNKKPASGSVSHPGPPN